MKNVTKVSDIQFQSYKPENINDLLVQKNINYLAAQWFDSLTEEEKKEQKFPFMNNTFPVAFNENLLLQLTKHFQDANTNSKKNTLFNFGIFQKFRAYYNSNQANEFPDFSILKYNSASERFIIESVTGAFFFLFEQEMELDSQNNPINFLVKVSKFSSSAEYPECVYLLQQIGEIVLLMNLHNNLLFMELLNMEDNLYFKK